MMTIWNEHLTDVLTLRWHPYVTPGLRLQKQMAKNSVEMGGQ